MYSGVPATSASWMARLVASPSSRGGRVMPWYTGSVWPLAAAWAAMTSMAMPFSACIMMSPPLWWACCMARRILPSSL